MAAAILVGVGGFFGALTRYFLDRRVTDWTGGSVPWGTFVINVSASFLVGLTFALVVERAALPQQLRAPLMIGFLGAYSTFSTLMLESWRLIEDGAWLIAVVNIGGSILVGMIAVIAGVLVGRAI
ncbi:MAG TPA: CrcB family protein [Candidatus Limnocylindrales bacterium]